MYDSKKQAPNPYDILVATEHPLAERTQQLLGTELNEYLGACNVDQAYTTLQLANRLLQNAAANGVFTAALVDDLMIDVLADTTRRVLTECFTPRR